MRIHLRALGCLTVAIAVGTSSCGQSGSGAGQGGGATSVVTPTAAAPSLHAGHLFIAPDAPWFTPCGSAEKWLFQGDTSPATDYLKRRPHLAIPRGWGPPVVYVRLRGTLAEPPTPSAERRWERQIDVSEIVEVKRQADDCPLPASP